MKKSHYFLIAVAVSFLVSNLITIPVMVAKDFFHNAQGAFTILPYLRWEGFFLFFFVALSCVLASHKFTTGRFHEVLFILSSLVVIDIFLSYLVFTLVECEFKLTEVDWLGSLDVMTISWKFYLIGIAIFILLLFGYSFINKDFITIFTKDGIFGKGKLKQVSNSNLENSRWMTDSEKRKLFKVYNYSQLKDVDKDGIPVVAKLDSKGKDMEVGFNSPCHSIVIGSTGSGKTTTFVSPMIQLLASTKAGSSMVITDPKGELFSLHSKYLKEKGYDVKVIDLRDTYSSYRWNPLESIWDAFEDYRTAHQKAYKRKDDATKSGLVLDPDENYIMAKEWYEFDGKAYVEYEKLITAVKLYKKKIYDEIYEDLNDLVSILVPIENDKDPLWEKGARSIILATLLAMLEDAEDPQNEMTKEKFNFFNMAKILQNSTDDYIELRRYFAGRSSLSKAYSLSKQVCDAAPTTRASYMSIVYDKLVLFNDAGICALTSESDFNSASLANAKTALFLKIKNEKDTRHNLAAVFILNIYKTLIKIASAREDLALPRNVYFIMDEFGNMPKIEKFDKFITVGRSRKIWFTMIVQSYAQLNNVYGETIADIIKGNCGIKMFIGSNDVATCKEYSELCGNITVATTSTSGTATSETNYSTSLQVRPLIYPSELQRLNHPGDIGHSIIVTFGNYPLKTYFTPSFKVPLYQTGAMDLTGIQERGFDENAIYYDITKRNERLIKDSKKSNLAKTKAGEALAKQDEEQKAPKEEISQETIMKLFEEAQKEDPTLTFMDFCTKIAKGEITIPKEVNNGK